jgi:hypothetical protein
MEKASDETPSILRSELQCRQNFRTSDAFIRPFIYGVVSCCWISFSHFANVAFTHRCNVRPASFPVVFSGLSLGNRAISFGHVEL